MLYPGENIEAIRLRLDSQYNAPLIGTVPYLAPPDARQAATHIDSTLLLQTLQATDAGH
jgi:dethiobiotin synthetase